MSATCRSCGRPLLFVENVATGARLPLVDTPLHCPRGEVKPGMVVVSPSGRTGRVLTLADVERWPESLARAIAQGRLHVTHFADCSDRKAWQGTTRRGRGL